MANTKIVSAHTEFLPTAQLAAATSIEADARGLAAHGLPSADQDTPSKAEAQAIEIIAARIGKRHGELADDALTIRGLLAEIPDTRTDAASNTLPAIVTGRIMSTFQSLGAVIRETVAGERQGRAEFNAYRHKHNLLERGAQYPISKVRHFAFVALLALGESAANAAMYFGAAPAGWTGALLTAIAVAAVNIALAVLAGLVWRYVNLQDLPPDQPNRHRNSRLWAIPTLGIAVALIVCVNLFAAHYREVATAAENFDEAQVLQHLHTALFDLALSSLVLLVTGLLCAILAAYKAYTSTDKYPGYERADRRYLEKAEARDDLKTTIHGSLDAIRHTEVDGLFNRTLAVRAMLDDIRKRHTTLLIAADRTAKLDSADIAAGIATIARFRRLNRDVRTDGLTPAYFANAIDFAALVPEPEHQGLADLITTVTEENVAHTEKLLALISRELERIEIAKDNTDTIMAAIERSAVKDKDVPELAELRRIISLDKPIPQIAA